MFLKIKQEKSITAEYWPVTSAVTIATLSDVSFDNPDVVATVSFCNNRMEIFKWQSAWLVNDEGTVLEVINRDYIWSKS